MVVPVTYDHGVFSANGSPLDIAADGGAHLVDMVQELIKPYVASLTKMIDDPYTYKFAAQPDRTHSPINAMPKKITNFIAFPGMGFNLRGDGLCNLNKDTSQFFKYNFYKECESRVRIVSNRQKNIPISALKFQNSFIQKVKTNMDINWRVNFDKALEYIERTFLKEDFFTKSEEDILSFFNHLHARLSHGYETEDTYLNSGSYRRYVSYWTKFEKQEDFIQELRKQLPHEEFESFSRGWDKIVKKESNQTEQEDVELTEDELKVWNKYARISPMTKEIPRLMREFVKKLKLLIKDNYHPLAIAAWAHDEFFFLAPYSSNNEHIARFLVEAILVRGRFYPIIFWDENDYKEALIKNHHSPGTFAEYLANQVVPTRQHAKQLYMD